MEDRIKRRALTGNISLIANPELIKVKTIKKKYVEQARGYNVRHGEIPFVDDYTNRECVGKTANEVIFIEVETGTLYSMSRVDFISNWITMRCRQDQTFSDMTTNRQHDAANAILESIPTLYKD